jgi:hypothetical protein
MNDLYRRFLRRDATERHYVLASRVATFVTLVLSVVVTIFMDQISKVWEFLLTLGAGTGLVYILRWYWWRVNAWSEIAAMSAAIVCAAVFRLAVYRSEESFNAHGFRVLLISAAAVTGVWLVVTFLTPVGDAEKLKAFYRRVRPAGPFWRPIAAQVRAEDGPARVVDPGYSALRAFACWIAGIVLVYCILFGTGKLLLGEVALGLTLFIPVIPAIVVLQRNLQVADEPAMTEEHISPERRGYEVIAPCAVAERVLPGSSGADGPT